MPRSVYRELLAAHGLVGSMGRRGNPYDNAKAESFMKTLKVEAVYPMAYETFADVADRPSALHRRGLQQPPAPFRARLPEPATVRGSTHPADGQISSLILSAPRGPLHQWIPSREIFHCKLGKAVQYYSRKS